MKWFIRGFFISILAPLIATLPFLFSFESKGVDPSTDASSLWMSSSILGANASICSVFMLHSLNLSFAKIPIGLHSILALIMIAGPMFLVSASLRTLIQTILPFEALLCSLIGGLGVEILLSVKMIPIKNRLTKEIQFWGRFSSLSSIFFF